MTARIPVPALLQRRFLVISGKGGVGRTTVAATLAETARRSGLRVLLAQMDAPERLTRLLGAPRIVGPEVVEIRTGLSAVNMTPRSALLEYGQMVLRYESLARALFDSRAARGFLGAVPGLEAYAMLGKAWWHTTERASGRPRYDLVILDGPASGHALTMLRVPQAILDAVPRGPLAKDAAQLRDLLCDPERSLFVPVTLAEELPALETSQLVPRVRETLRMGVGPLFVNGVLPASAASPALDPLLERLRPDASAPEIRPVLGAAALLRGERRRTEAILARLAGDPGLPLIELPALPTSDLGPEEVDDLVEALLRAR